jgi:hypothetical protein
MVNQSRLDEAVEQWMGPVGARFELGVELAGHEVRVVDALDNLYQVSLRVESDRSDAPALVLV